MSDLLACKPRIARVQWDLAICDHLQFAYVPTVAREPEFRDVARAYKGVGTSLGVTDFIAGKYGNAILLDGGNDWIKWNGANRLSGVKEISVLALVKPLSATATQIIFSVNSGDTAQDLMLSYGFADSKFEVWWGDSPIATSSITFSTGKWWNAVVVRRGIPGAWTGEVWVNGRLYASTATATDPAGAIAGTPIYIGRESQTALAFNGGVAGCMAWSRALQPSEIRALAVDPWLPVRPRGVMEMSELSGQGFMAVAAAPVVAATGGQIPAFPPRHNLMPFPMGSF